MTNHKLKKIKRLIKSDKEYNEVIKLIEQGDLYTIYDRYYDKYGNKILEYAIDGDIQKLLREGKFLDIYNKYGETTYNKYLNYMKTTDMELTTGNKMISKMNYYLYKIKHNIMLPIISQFLGIFIGTTIAADIVHNVNVNENQHMYKEEIEKYNNDLKNKANEIKNMNLTDFQIVMKVFYDVYTQNVYEMPKTEYDIEGFQGLSVNEENKGVCRNYSSYLTDLLNEIKPELNARNINVQLGEKESSIDYLIGNHQVTAADVDDTTLIIDPTNFFIGVFDKGQIKILSSFDKNMQPRPLSQVRWQGYSNMIILLVDMTESFLSGNDLEKIEEKYGINAQYETLEYIRRIEEQTKKQKAEGEDDINEINLLTPRRSTIENFKLSLLVKGDNNGNGQEDSQKPVIKKDSEETIDLID